MTDTAPTPNDPVDILTVTRKIFAATHWTAGTYTGLSFPDDDADVEALVNAEAPGPKAKPIGCAVGGLRYAAMAPMEHALDETWLFANFIKLGGEAVGDSEVAETYLAAMEYLFQVIDENAWLDYCRYYRDIGERRDVWASISRVEDAIVTWNDSRGYDPDSNGVDDDARRNVVEEEILPAFDEAIRLATAAKADQAETDTTEGS